jgi:DinB superfamily
VTGALTAEDRSRIAQALDESLERLRQAILDLTPAQWTFKPSDDIWSIAECCDHIGGAEKLFLKMVRRGLIDSPERAEAVQGKHKIVRKAITNRQVRVKVPVLIAPFGNVASPQEFEPAFAAARAETLDYVRTTEDPLHLRVQAHFMLGDFDGAQWLELIAAHCQRHCAQIDEVKASAGYP